MKKIFVVVIAVILSAPAFAQDFKTLQIATNLGSVIGSEEFCGLEYNQEAIQAYIEKEVPANDMGFASTLNTMIEGSKFEHQSMGKSAKTAHCTQIRRTAKAYGFIE